MGVPSRRSREILEPRYVIRTRNLQDWNLTRYRCANRSVEDSPRTPPRYIWISESHGRAIFSTMQQHWPWCLMHVEGHLTPIAQQHKPIWQQTSLSTKDSQHVSGGTPNLRQARWTQQRSSPLHEAPMHSGQSAYKLKLQQRHPLMRMRSDLCAVTIAARVVETIAARVYRHDF